LKRLFNVLKSWQGLVGSMGSIVPALTFFSSVTPPLLTGASVFSAALALAILLSVFQRATNSPKAKTNPRPLWWGAIGALALSVAILVLYLGLLKVCTATGAPEGGSPHRFQIGFGKWENGLTQEGKAVRRASPSGAVEQWMLDDGLFSEDGPRVLWKTWTIYTAGTVLALSFVLVFCLWSAGWSLLAAVHALSTPATSRRRNDRIETARRPRAPASEPEKQH
jgi:hypothetical protein